MRALASSLSAWRLLERQEGIKVPHGLTFPLAVVAAIGRPHGLVLVAEEEVGHSPDGFDAIFVSVMDSRCMTETGRHFARWRLPMLRADRPTGGPLVWAGGQGLHNPEPYAEIADLIVLGDAEDPLPALLDLWHSHGNTPRFLDEAARVPGVYVPTVHGPDTPLEQAVTDDISITLSDEISVSHDGTRRIEIARGCKYSCKFCSLGWRTPLRENPAVAVVDTIRRSPKRVHLQAGDAESHTGIDTIRGALRAHGGIDTGWTGRLDSLFENPDQTIPGHKRYAFGVEGVSHRLRLAVGKGYLTDERLITDTIRFFGTIEGDGHGRAAWHLIAGLPGETPLEVFDLGNVVEQIDRRWRGRPRRNLALHWQPFQPLPGTPMQWCGAGGGARRHAATLATLARLPAVRVEHVTGRTDGMAKVCTILSRCDGPAASRLLAALTDGPVTPDDAARLTGRTWQHLDPDEPLPWDRITTRWAPDQLRQAHRVLHERLEGTGR